MSAFCDLAESYPWQETRPGFFGSDLHIRREPVGVVAAIVPWNMPQFLIATKLVPALLAGCCVVLKPAPESPLDALLLAEMLAESGCRRASSACCPATATSATIWSPTPASTRCRSRVPRRRTAVAAACGAELKRVSLELGGKSAAIILDDADPAAVATGIRSASLSNSGQICNALTRILVPASRSDDFVDALAAEMATIVVGDPADPTTQVGPLVAQRQQQRVRDYIDTGRREGARLVLGGTDLPEGLERGWYVRPTLFSRRRQLHDDRPRGDLRPGADRHSVPRRRRAVASPTTPTTGSPVRCGPTTPTAA